MRAGLIGALALGLVLRLGAIAASDRVVADVARYEKVARHLLDVSWNPYTAPHLYPYPPPWAGIEAAAGWLDRHTGLPFAVIVKLPVLAADLMIVWLLGAAAAGGRASPLAAWLYAAHPVALLVGGFHGQFDAIPLGLVMLALEALARGRRDASALALAGAIAAKSFPVLLLPALAAAAGSGRQALRYVVLACLPVAVLLVPFAAADSAALRRELFGYAGIADFGWTGVWRGLEWLVTGALPRSEARFWPLAAAVSKVAFLATWCVLLLRARQQRWSAERVCLMVVLAFVSLYGLLSAQYLLWPVPLGLMRVSRHAAAYAVAATAALAGFYPFLAAGVLSAAAVSAATLAWCGRLWVAGSAAALVVSFGWLVALLLEPRRGGETHPPAPAAV
jgi:hypothetical protein